MSFIIASLDGIPDWSFSTLCVSVLSVLVTVLIGWQIFSAIALNKLVKKSIENKLKVYDANVEKKLAVQQTELLTAMMMLQFDAESIDMILILGSHIPEQMQRANVVSEKTLSSEIDKLEEALNSIDKHPSEHALFRLIEAYRPFARFSIVYVFLQRLEALRNKAPEE